MPTTDLPIPGAGDVPSKDSVSRSTEARVEASSVTTSLSAIGTANAENLSATGSLIAASKSGNMEATGSAVLLTQADGDVSMQLCAAPLVMAKGDATFRQSYGSAFVSGGRVSISQGGAPIVVGREIAIEVGGGGALFASEITVRRSWIGVLLAGRSDVAEDSRVLLDTRGALILAAALLGGFGVVAVAVYLGAHKLSRWRPSLPPWIRR